MTDTGIGALGYVGYAKETTEATAVAPTMFLAATRIEFPDSNDYNTPLLIQGSRDVLVALQAPYSVTGTLELPLPSMNIGYLLKSAFAATAASSAYVGGGYTHILTPGSASDTFTFEKSAQDVLIMRYTGIRVNTLQIKAAHGEIVSSTFGLDGIDRAKQATPATPTYDASVVNPFHFTRSKVTIAGADSSVVKDWTLNVNNNVTHVGTLRSTRAYKRVALGAREVGLSMTLDFVDTTEYDRLLNDSEFAVSLYMEAGTGVGAGGTSYQSLKLDLPRVRYKTVGLPINAGDLLSQDVECTVLKPVSGVIATVTLVNNESSLA